MDAVVFKRQADRDDRAPTERRLASATMPGIVLIGASTGGPQALVAVIGALAPALARVPVCVTLHMPSDLMPIIAAHVARTCRVATAVVTERRRLELGTVFFAPGDRHLVFKRMTSSIEMSLAIGQSGEFCRPAIDVMFTSAAASHGSRSLGVVLSGMGKDGLAGSRAIVAAGGSVLVQDKSTSAVWGMPGAVVKADLAAGILSPPAIGLSILARVAAGAGKP